MICQNNVHEALNNYNELGYCVVSELYSLSEIKSIEHFFDELYKNGGVFPGQNVDSVNVDTTRIQSRSIKPHLFSDQVMKWFTHAPVAEVLRILFGAEPIGAQCMYYYKPPGSSGLGLHQDNFYLKVSPGTTITSWTSIDDADEENGCLLIVPKTHTLPILCPERDERDGIDDLGNHRQLYTDLHMRVPEGSKAIAVPTKRGDTVFFNGSLIHGSLPNVSKVRWRRSFTAHYVDSATREISSYHHPLINMQGRAVEGIGVNESGGPCGKAA